MKHSVLAGLALAVCAASIAACSAGSKTVPAAPGVVSTGTVQIPMPSSVSPARIPVPPMAHTPAQAATAMSARRPQSDISMVGWTQLPGGAVFVAASPDGSLFALSTLGNGSDQYVFHYVNGSWTGISGAAARLAVAPNGSLWAVTAAGGIYVYSTNSSTPQWTPIAGGGSDITVGSDGSVYVISSQGGGPYGRGIWRYKNGNWTQMPGAGTRIAASWDQTAFGGGVQPGGFYVINTNNNIFYYDPTVAGFHTIAGGAFQVAPTRSGGLFALGIPQGQYGYPIYYEDLNSASWSQQAGAGTSITTDGVTVYVTGLAGGIYSAPINAHHIVGNGAPLAGPTYGPNAKGWGPRAVANALNFPVQSGFDGTGMTVAIVIDSTVLASDMSAYKSYFQTPNAGGQLTTFLMPNASATPTADGQFEATLDAQTVVGLAPGANVILYVMPDLSFQHTVDAYNQVLNDGTASIVSSSFGGCENTSSEQNGADTVIASGTSNGVAFIAISGDWGNECYYTSTTYHQGVNWPGSNPNVISVGGNETYGHPLTYPVAWNDSFANAGQEATGGGVSTKFALPTYQNALAGAASTTNRNVPDIALPAVDDAIYLNGSWQRAVGTSWSTPMFAAMLAEAYQYCNSVFYDPIQLPYYAASVASATAFIDVTSGNNQFQSTSPYYTAAAGYDNTTGLGIPLGMPFAQTICPNRVPAARVRKPMSSRMAFAAYGPAQAVQADVVPLTRGIADRGARAPSATTRIQLVLRRTATLASDEQTVIGVLQAAGFTIARTFRNHLVVDAEGPSANVESLFSTRMHDVTEGRYGTRYMPVTAAAIPASLAPYVAGISLDDVVAMKHL